MRRLVYDAKEIFADIEARLNRGERIITFSCELPDCTPSEGKIYFHRQGEGYVVGICGSDNQKNVVYNGDNRDFKWLVSKQAIHFSHMPQIFNMFFRFDGIYSSDADRLTYYVDGYGYYQDGKYVFKFEKKSGSWRAYIEQMPSLNGRDASASVTHRLTDGARQYVCIQGNVSTKDKMKSYAKTWANHIQKYIKTGQRFG